MLFVSSRDDEPSAAFVKMNEPDGAREDAIRQNVRSGFLIRTRADSPTIEARTGNTARRDAAFRSGARSRAPPPSGRSDAARPPAG